MAFQHLNGNHDRSNFDCGNELINKFLKEQANKASKRNLSKTFVIEGEVDTDIAGFYSLSDTYVTVPLDHKSYKSYPHPLPGVLLARMGVDLGYQGQGIARILVVDAMKRTLLINENMGVVGLFVDAKDDALVEFYKKCGFIFLLKEEHTSKLWMPISSIEKFFKDRE
ncbi:GNAT family N-acetyltransferase [Marinomonas fungiae]|uniref:GNAT family N-acetyltransferase n=1 Tax=Marinomonas fungiae TaxID=1137284 RepID=UPI003A941DF6